MEKQLKDLVEEKTKKAIQKVLKEHGVYKEKPKVNPSKLCPKIISTLIKEGFTLQAKPYKLNTEKLSDGAKKSHIDLYKNYIEMFGKVSVAGDVANREEANSSSSTFRTLKIDEVFLLNAVKFHELYFSNISDLASEISIDSLPFMRLCRDFGTFENWQFDFMAAAEASRSGWAMVVFEPYRDRYMNIVVDNHSTGIPLGAIPVLVLDMWEHAWFKDYSGDKKSYITSMMKELNWNVIEARMLVAERTDINTLYQIQSADNTIPGSMLDRAQTSDGLAPDTSPTHEEQVPAEPPTESPMNSNENPRNMATIHEGKKK